MKKEMENQTGQSRSPSSTTSNVPSDQLSLKEQFKTYAQPLLKMDKEQWLKDMRGNLSLVTALISTITFQAALNPPGGVVQTSTGPANTLIDCNLTVGEKKICTGEAVLAAKFSDTYLYFIRFNTFSFVASLSAALLLVSGIPLRHRFPMWFLSIAMSASLTSLAITYLYGVLLVTPEHIHTAAVNSFKVFMWIWIGSLGLVSLFLIIRFLVWFDKKKPQATQMSKEEKRTNSIP